MFPWLKIQKKRQNIFTLPQVPPPPVAAGSHRTVLFYDLEEQLMLTTVSILDRSLLHKTLFNFIYQIHKVKEERNYHDYKSL